MWQNWQISEIWFQSHVFVLLKSDWDVQQTYYSSSESFARLPDENREFSSKYSKLIQIDAGWMSKSSTCLKFLTNRTTNRDTYLFVV